MNGSLFRSIFNDFFGASTDSTSSGTLRGDIKALLANSVKFLFDVNGWLRVTLATALSSTTDSIDVAKMSAGGLQTALPNTTAATTASAELDCRGFNSVIIEIETNTVSSSDKVWTTTITGSCMPGGTFGQIFQNVAGTQTALVLPTMAFGEGNLKKCFVIQGGIPNFIKLTSTLAGTNGTSKIGVNIVPFNV